MSSLPDKFTVKITEGDRQQADRFSNNCACLIATAVRRSLATRRSIGEGVDAILIGSGKAEVAYRHDYCGAEELHVDQYACQKPFYKSSIVGRQITFTRIRRP